MEFGKYAEMNREAINKEMKEIIEEFSDHEAKDIQEQINKWGKEIFNRNEALTRCEFIRSKRLVIIRHRF